MVAVVDPREAAKPYNGVLRLSRVPDHDLMDVSRRLAGSAENRGSFTVLSQQDGSPDQRDR
jgi:hypothetical protein